MGDEPYLILHKVRGEPAFDVAHKLMIGDEEGWIIPTSGHRAYPYQWFDLKDLHWSPTSIEPLVPITDACQGLMAKLADAAWPDHYGVKAAPTSDLRSFIARIIPRKPFTKRVL